MGAMFSLLFLFIIIVDVLFCAPVIINDSKNGSFDDSGDDSKYENTSEGNVPKRNIIKSRFFQDIFYEHLEPLLYHFGHACENPTEYEQRFEQRDFENNRHQGKVLWGNANGNYGEHYWDLASGK